MSDKPYTSRDVAALLGHTGTRGMDWFYRNFDKLRAAGMPAPILPFGYYKFDRASIDAWIRRHHPLAPTRPANDDAPSLAPSSSADWQAHLHNTYSRSR